jgi:hypothetical protein
LYLHEHGTETAALAVASIAHQLGDIGQALSSKYRPATGNRKRFLCCRGSPGRNGSGPYSLRRCGGGG